MKQFLNMASAGFIASCCLGNKSIFIDRDLLSYHTLLQEKAVSGVSLTFAILSTVGLFVVLYPWRCFRKQSSQRVSQHLQGPNLIYVVYCIITAALIGNIGKLELGVGITDPDKGSIRGNVN